MRIVAIDHVQLAMPAGGEPAARGFYTGVLGLPELPKPPHLAGRGGCWFESADVKIHLGVEGDFRPARKAHPALLVSPLRELLDRCRRAGFDVTPDEPLGRRERAYVSDPFGNRIELIDAPPAPAAHRGDVQQVYATLRITDYARSRRFYVEGLGFQIDWEHRVDARDPVFMQVTRDGLSLYLSEHAGDCEVGGLVHLYVPDVDAWHAELAKRGVPVAYAPCDQPWGNRDMRILDPDGNQLCVCTPIRRRP